MASRLSPISEGVGRRSGLKRNGRGLGFPVALVLFILAVVGIAFVAGYLFGRAFLS